MANNNKALKAENELKEVLTKENQPEDAREDTNDNKQETKASAAYYIFCATLSGFFFGLAGFILDIAD